METGLPLLMRDGAVHVRFSPRLNSAEYDELMQVVQEPRTVAELQAALQAMAAKWAKEVDFDE